MKRARRLPVLRRASLALLAVVCCGPVQGAPASPAPVNTCTASACENYDQTPNAVCEARSNTCEVRATAAQSYEYTLVVTLPDSSTFRGLTYAIPSSDFPKTILSNGLRLPLPASMRGRYLASPKMQEDVGRYLYESGKNVVVPSRTIFYRRWPTQSGEEDARSVGLPLDVVFPIGVITAPAGPDGGLNGPGGTASWSFEAQMTTSTAQASQPATYELVTSPEPPFDDAYPPAVRTVRVLPGGDATLDPEPVYGNSGGNSLGVYTKTVSFQREDGRLDGFRAWFADSKTGRRLSNVVTLSGESAKARLHMLGRTAGAELEGLRLVVQPPVTYEIDPDTGEKREAPPALPTFDDQIVGEILDPTYYPNFTIVTLNGRLRGPRGLTEGIVYFDAQRKSIEACPSSKPDCPAAQSAIALRLRTWTRTSGGAFSIKLPRGVYDVYATPLDEPGLGRLKRTLSLTQPAPTPEVFVELTFPQLRRLQGRCVLTDGRLLADAEVEARPAVKLLGDKIPEEAWPRPAWTRTNTDGNFILALDAGVYDIVVRPAPGTRLPWLVHPNTEVPEQVSVTTLDDLRVPAPLRQSFVVRDPDGFGVASATVRAFANVVGSKLYVETGRALTDNLGRFELYLGPAPR